MEQFTLVQIPNSHSLRLTVNSSVTGVEEITPEWSSLSLTTSLKLFITQMHDCGFGLIEPRLMEVFKGIIGTAFSLLHRE